MKIRACNFLVLLLLVSCNGIEEPVKINGYKEHSLLSELESLRVPGTLPVYADNSYCAQVSSWDTTGGNDDGFSGRYSFIRKNDDGSAVILDVKGAGVVNRIWTPTPNTDTLDFYIDNETVRSFSISFIDLFSGNVFPFVEPLCGNQLGGYFCYTPIPFQKSCKIIARSGKIQFHQIQYRLYNDNKKVIPFNIMTAANEKEAVARIAAVWNRTAKPGGLDSLPGIVKKTTGLVLTPGKRNKVLDIKGGGRILGIEISPADAFEGLSRNTDIRVTWDNEKTAAVYCPAADFFGHAFGEASMQSLLLGNNGISNYCYFPMPFDDAALVEIITRDDESSSPGMRISVTIWYSKNRRDPSAEGKFYALRNSNREAKAGVPHTFADIRGKGHYVGTILQAQGLKSGMTLFFEGDDSTSVDGTFRMHGTGSEDYFNGGWYALMDRWDGKMSLPLHGSLGYSLPFCRTGGYRLFISDRISFERSLFHSIEHGPVGNAFPVDYTSVSLFYCDSEQQHVQVPDSENTRFFMPDTLVMYPQLMDMTISGNLDIKTTWKYGTGGESYTLTPSGDSWLRFSLREIPDGEYSIYYDIITGPEGCDFSVWHRQTMLSEWITSGSIKEQRNEKLYVCNLNVSRMNNTITTRFRTENNGKSLLLNRIILIREKGI